jgi:hypothetical protein
MNARMAGCLKLKGGSGLTQSHHTNLVDRMMGFITQKPFFFYDIIRHFDQEEYRDLLVAWSAIRSKEKFDRDEDGRYIFVGTVLK